MKLKNLIVGATAVLLTGIGALQGAQAQDEYPSRPITFVLPNNPGGSTDRLARLLAPYLSDEIGVPVNIENKPGARSLVGNTYFFQQKPDGHTFLYTALPYMVNNIENQGASFTMDDAAWVNVPQVANTVVFVPKDSPYTDLASLVEDLKVPGKLSAGVIGGSAEHILVLLLMDRLGVPRDNLRLVTYDGGGPTRTAIAGGQVDFAMIPGQGSQVIAEMVRPLAVVAKKPIADFDAPLLNEALEPVGIELPIIPSSTRVILTHKAFQMDQPENFAKFIAAYERANANPDFQAEVKKAELGADWTGPEEAKAIIDENYKMMQDYSSVIEQ